MCRIRWMIRVDMPEVCQIENDSFDDPWGEEDFIRHLRELSNIAMVAEDSGGNVVGYIVYELHKKRIRLLKIAVSPRLRRRGIGRTLIEKLTSKLTFNRRSLLQLEVRDDNLHAHLFFREVGFRAVSVTRNTYLFEQGVHCEV